MSPKDTYGNELPSEIPMWKAMQQRNATITKAGAEVVKKNADICRPIHFYSQGSLVRGYLWDQDMKKEKDLPPSQRKKKPGIVMCHGIGGLAAFLNVRYAPKYAAAGFVVLTFDYRGWGESDGIVIQLEDKDRLQRRARENDAKEQVVVMGNAKVRVVRQILDMSMQLADIEAAVSFLVGEPNVSKIGLFGSSHGGGHVLTCASREADRVHCVVSQVPSCGKHGAGSREFARLLELSRWHARESARTGVLPNGARSHHLKDMDGSPILRGMVSYDPLLACPAVSQPTLIIDVENEELWDVNRNGKAAYDLIKANKVAETEYFLLKNSNHYQIYQENSRPAIEKALEFFTKHLIITSSKL